LIPIRYHTKLSIRRLSCYFLLHPNPQNIHMENVTFSLTQLDENDVPLEPLIVGGEVCYIAQRQQNLVTTALTVRIDDTGEIPVWKDTCIQFRTNSNEQILRIKLHTQHFHTPTQRPLFHFIKLVSLQGFPKIKEMRCYTGPMPGPHNAIRKYGQEFPVDTHTIDIVFGMSGLPGDTTPQFKVDLVVTRKDTGAQKFCDPQVGNEPP
jgi:hypothetical protein